MKQYDPLSFLTKLVFLSSLIGSVGCSESYGPCTFYDRDTEAEILNATFRIDITRIEATFDFKPELNRIEAKAVLTLSMRSGQTRPLIHFDSIDNDDYFRYQLGPGTTTIESLALDEQTLSLSDPDDVRKISFPKSKQKALEIQRELTDSTEHRLEMDYVFVLPTELDYLHTIVNDYYGIGNEIWFPTINSPEELTRHQLTFRVHSETPYAFIGSGWISENEEADVQEWILDTEHEISSYTLMFVLAPEDKIKLSQRTVQGIDVRIMARQDSQEIDEAFDQLDSWLLQLDRDLGPFPMPSGLSIFLLSTPAHQGETGFAIGTGGMEYYGGTITELWALRHEVFHMYFGCSLISHTYRDSWWDEAFNIWYELYSHIYPISSKYRSGMVGDRSPIQLGFNLNAYEQGAQMIQALAHQLGGPEEMVAFMKYLYTNYTFYPFNTVELIGYFKDYFDVDLTDLFISWLYYGTCT